jgi:dihydrofolate reductase
VIIGGGYLFRESINYFNKLVITLVDCEIENGDIFYPEIDLRNWKLEKEDVIKKDDDNEYDFKVRVLTKNY